MTVSKVDLAELAMLAEEVRRAKTSLDAGVQGFSQAPTASPSPPTMTRSIYGVQTRQYVGSAPTIFGNTSAGDACLGAHSWARSGMDGTLKAFAGTVESDHGRLEMAWSTYKKNDAEAADRMLEISRNRLDILTTHLSTKNQSGQIKELNKLVGDPSKGNMIVTGDFNATSTPGTPSGDEIQNFGKKGFDVGGGVINDGQGGTSATHRPIDQVMPRGVGALPAQRWNREQSDHDGQLVDIVLPNW